MGYRTAYCSLDEVRRLLSVQEQKIKFSEAYQRLEWNTSNKGNGRLTGFIISDDYQGHERMSVTFSDSTNFTMMGEKIGYLGDGSRLDPFTSLDGMFTIEADKWTGEPQVADEFSFTTISNVSNSNARLFMTDALDRINGKFRVVYGDSTNIPFYDESYALPGEIRVAGMMLSACSIFKAAFVGASQESMPVVDWCEEWEDIIDAFIEDLLKSLKGAPGWRSKPAHIVDTGIEGVEEGLIGESDVTDNESYTR